MPAELIIHAGNADQHLQPPPGYSKGHIERDFAKYPVGYLKCARPFDLPLIPEANWQAILDARKAGGQFLSTSVRQFCGPSGGRMPSRDQNGKGYCWFHSGTSAMLLARGAAGEPWADLSAYMGACLIKNYRDEGGWGAEGVEWVAVNGIATSDFWPQQSMSRSNDTPEMRANAKLHRWTEWRDLDDSGPNLKAQLVTALLMGYPVVVDFNWWSHSVCAVDLVSLNPFQIRIWNSWGDGWSDGGMGILEGNHAMPNGALVCCVDTPSYTAKMDYSSIMVV
jgi:hypothetical protein